MYTSAHILVRARPAAATGTARDTRSCSIVHTTCDKRPSWTTQTGSFGAPAHPFYLDFICIVCTRGWMSASNSDKSEREMPSRSNASKKNSLYGFRSDYEAVNDILNEAVFCSIFPLFSISRKGALR